MTPENNKKSICEFCELRNALTEARHELNVKTYALSRACHDLARMNNVIFSTCGRHLTQVLEDTYLRHAEHELEIERLTFGESEAEE